MGSVPPKRSIILCSTCPAKVCGDKGAIAGGLLLLMDEGDEDRTLDGALRAAVRLAVRAAVGDSTKASTAPPPPKHPTTTVVQATDSIIRSLLSSQGGVGLEIFALRAANLGCWIEIHYY